MVLDVRVVLREEVDFFVRELEKMNLVWNEGLGDDGMSELDVE